MSEARIAANAASQPVNVLDEANRDFEAYCPQCDTTTRHKQRTPTCLQCGSPDVHCRIARRAARADEQVAKPQPFFGG